MIMRSGVRRRTAAIFTLVALILVAVAFLPGSAAARPLGVGQISGTVTSDGGTSLRPGISVFAYNLVGTTWTLVGSTSTNASGIYALTLPPDTYHLYFRDPTGTYVKQYYDKKTTLAGGDPVVVADGGSATADADLVGCGHIRGTVTSGGGTTPRPGIAVYAYNLVGSTWTYAGSTSTNSGGGYILTLAPDTYHLYFKDPAGNFKSQYYDKKTTLAGGDPVVVGSYSTAAADADLKGFGYVTGAVTSGGGTTPRPGITVYAYSLVGSTWTLVGSTSTNGSGVYHLTVVEDTYHLYFKDPAGTYVKEYWDNKTTLAGGDPVVVAPGATVTADADLAAYGHITGTVTSGGGTTPRPGIAVYAYNLVGSTWTYAGSTSTNGSGNYALTLPPDTYHLYFKDPTGTYLKQYYDKKTTLAGGDPVVLGDGGTAVADADLRASVHTLTYTAGAHGTIVGTSPQTVADGANGSEVDAIPDDGYYFVGWSDSPLMPPKRKDVNVTADVNATAVFALVITRYEQDDPNIFYQGTWITQSRAWHSNGTYAYTNSADSTVTIKFHGRQITYVTNTDTIYGIARVTLDRGLPTELTSDVDLYNPVRNVAQQPVWSAMGLPNTDHTLTIEWTGTKNPASGGTYIGLDAVDVAGTLIPAP